MTFRWNTFFLKKEKEQSVVATSTIILYFDVGRSFPHRKVATSKDFDDNFVLRYMKEFAPRIGAGASPPTGLST